MPCLDAEVGTLNVLLDAKVSQKRMLPTPDLSGNRLSLRTQNPL